MNYVDLVEFFDGGWFDYVLLANIFIWLVMKFIIMYNLLVNDIIPTIKMLCLRAIKTRFIGIVIEYLLQAY